MRLFSIFIILSIFIPTPLLAESRCDCTKAREGECRANIQMSQDNWISIKSNTEQCSEVVWYADDDIQYTIVTDGTSTEEGLGSKRPKNVFIESCDLCFDTEYQQLSNSSESTAKNECESIRKNTKQAFEEHIAYYDKISSVMNICSASR